MKKVGKTEQFAMRLTSEGKRLLEALAGSRGISQAGIVEQLVRDEAERKGIKLEDLQEVCA